MTTKRLGLIMNGVTGRMGLNQHLIRSIIAIRDQGGVLLANGDRMHARSDPDRPRRRQGRSGSPSASTSSAGSTDLDKALADKNDDDLLRRRAPRRRGPRC